MLYLYHATSAYIILFSEILPCPLPEVTAPPSMCYCIAVGLDWQTDSETPVGHCAIMSSAATGWAADAPKTKMQK